VGGGAGQAGGIVGWIETKGGDRWGRIKGGGKRKGGGLLYRWIGLGWLSCSVSSQLRRLKHNKGHVKELSTWRGGENGERSVDGQRNLFH